MTCHEKSGGNFEILAKRERCKNIGCKAKNSRTHFSCTNVISAVQDVLFARSENVRTSGPIQKNSFLGNSGKPLLLTIIVKLY